jgi:hypothetical protein
MPKLVMFAFGLMLWQGGAYAQPADNAVSATTPAQPGGAKTGVVGEIDSSVPQDYAPPTTSERLRLYIEEGFGVQAIIGAAAAGGIGQFEDTPGEWRQGAKAYGERFGSAYAQQIIRSTLEAGGAEMLHEDNRYFRSGEGGFWRRSKHAIGSVFVARNEIGQEHFAYSRFGGSLGEAFLSRLWQPRSTDGAGEAMVNFGVAIGVDMGWNLFREFRPVGKGHEEGH